MPTRPRKPFRRTTGSLALERAGAAVVLERLSELGELGLGRVVRLTTVEAYVEQALGDDA